MGSYFVIEGLRELEAEMKAIDKRLVREISKANKAGGVRVAGVAKAYAPERTGKMKASIRPAAGADWFGARVTHPGAGVQEFAVDYIRRERGSVQVDTYHHRELRTGISRGLKKYYKATGRTGGATEEVHMVNVKGPPPRFLFKALEAIGPSVAEGPVWDAIQKVLRANGWWN